MSAKKTILLVEDDAIIALSSKRQLEQYGYTVIHVSTGEKAVAAILSKLELDLILMDINLGSGIDGTEAAEIILQENDIPIVFVSSHTEPEVVEKTEKISSYGYVVKATGITVLDSAIKMAFKLFDANKSIRRSESKQKAMILNISDVIGIIGADSIMRYKSPNIEKWFGWKPEDLVGTDGWHTVHPDDLKRIQKEFYAILKTDNLSINVEYRYKCKDGTYKIIELCATNLVNDSDINGILLNYHDISERIKVQEALRASEEKYRLQFLNFSSYNSLYEVVKDEEGKPKDFRFVMVNQAYEKYVGKNASDLIGKTLLEVYPETEQYWIDKMTEVAITGAPLQLEAFSKVMNLYTEVSLYLPQNGYLAMTTANITERKKIEVALQEKSEEYEIINEELRSTTEELQAQNEELIVSDTALRESEERFQLLFNNAPLGYQSLDIDGNFIEVNQQWLDTLGYSRKEVIGNWFGNFLAPAYRDAFRKRFPIFKAQGHIHSEFEMLHKNGRKMFISFDGKIGHDLNGAFKQTHCILQDISERKIADESLILSEAKYKALFENISDAIFIYDPISFEILSANKATSEIYGYDNDELIGMSCLKFSAEIEKSKVVAAQILNEGNARVPCRRHRKKDGSDIYVQISAAKVSVLGHDMLFTVCKDISEQRLANGKIESLLAEKELILKEVHHRIKNNLSTISSLLSLQTRAMKDSSAIHAFKDTESRVKSMSILYDKLYQANDVTQLSLKDYLPVLVKEIIANFPNNKSVEVEVLVDDFVLGAKRLQALGILVNELITNTMKYAFIEGESGFIFVSATSANGHVTICVQDDGKGIPESVSFENSTGFGLQLVQALTQQLDGTIQIERGNGTKFVLKFEQ